MFGRGVADGGLGCLVLPGGSARLEEGVTFVFHLILEAGGFEEVLFCCGNYGVSVGYGGGIHLGISFRLYFLKVLSGAILATTFLSSHKLRGFLHLPLPSDFRVLLGSRQACCRWHLAVCFVSGGIGSHSG